jgi:tetratricopeptide (TPR) repeat protein
VLQHIKQNGLASVGAVALFSGVLLMEQALADSPDRYVPNSALPPAVAASSQTSATGDAGAIQALLARQTKPVQGRTSLDIIAPQAQAHVDYALNLAERGAVQSAQAEFIAALDLVADALDADTGNAARAHARAAKAGLTALRETKDFVPSDTPHDIEINLSQLATTHQTPVLKKVDTRGMSRAEALQRYHTYATQQLTFAGGRSSIASSALYGLGRAETVTTAGASTRNPLGSPNAMAFYQAALQVDPQNYMASNELGVLMARYGDLEGAGAQFTHSISVKPQAETWHNLATVYRRMGQPESANRADQEREKLLAAQRNQPETAVNAADLAARPTVKWVDAETFAASSTPYEYDKPTGNSKSSIAVAQKDSLGKRLISKLTPWSKTDKAQTASTTDTAQPSQKPDSAQGSDAEGRSLFK